MSRSVNRSGGRSRRQQQEPAPVAGDLFSTKHVLCTVEIDPLLPPDLADAVEVEISTHPAIQKYGIENITISFSDDRSELAMEIAMADGRKVPGKAKLESYTAPLRDATGAVIVHDGVVQTKRGLAYRNIIGKWTAWAANGSTDRLIVADGRGFVRG